MGSHCAMFTRGHLKEWPICAWESCSSTMRLVPAQVTPRAPLAARIILPQFVPIVATLHPIKLRREVIISGHMESCITSCRRFCGIVDPGTSMLNARDCKAAARRLLHAIATEVKNEPAPNATNLEGTHTYMVPDVPMARSRSDPDSHLISRPTERARASAELQQ